MAALGDLVGRMDPDPRQRGKQFEHICKWFLTNDPVYKHELRRVWLWDEWPGRWGGDAGIDLVAEDRNGHLWAIQAKAYDPAYRVTKRDVNKFLAESGRAMFTYRMLIATTNLIDRIGERTIQDQEKRVTFFRLNDLEAADVDWPASPTALRPARPRRPARPHDYQREAIKKVIKGFISADRGQLVMACGTGKTLTALFITEKLEATRTLVLVPSLSLLKQTLNVWRANCTTEFASLPVCSDDTVANTDDDVALAHTSDLGVPVTTNPEKIAAFLRQRSGPRVVFATYQSSPQIAKAFTLGRVPAFDLVIADEAHRCAGPVSSDFATVLDAEKIKARRRLLMTATPRYFTGRILREAKEADLEVASMDNTAVFGPVFHRLGFAEAIQRKLLTDYRVIVVGVDDATYRDWAQRGELVIRDDDKKTDARTLAGQIGLAKAMRLYDLHRTISFHSRVKRAREFANSMPEVIAWMPARQRPKGHLWSKHASGEMPAGDRYVLLQHLTRLDDDDERGLLANARCLAEGVDVPTLDGVAFIDPRRSEVDIVQAVGRAIRLADDKTVGTIVIPVFVDTDEDPEAALDNSAFKPVWDVIKALRAHDDELGMQLDQLRRELGRRRGRLRLPENIRFDVPAHVSPSFARAFDVRLVQETTAKWEFWFGLLEAFIAERGHSFVPQRHAVNGHRLGPWVAFQRTSSNRGILRADRRQRLDELDGWVWSVLDAKWDEGYRQLLHYVEQNGHPNVPQGFITVDHYRLGGWVLEQRSNRATLAADRTQQLEKVDGWAWEPHDAWWAEGLRQMQDYIERHGDGLVSAKHITDDDYRLGQWVNVQRTNYAKGNLSADRAAQLEKLDGWVWDGRDALWEREFSRLLEFVNTTGALPRQADVTDDGFNVGQWMIAQRQFFRRGKLSADRIKRLEKEVPGWKWKGTPGPAR
jgi:predicted helicase